MNRREFLQLAALSAPTAFGVTASPLMDGAERSARSVSHRHPPSRFELEEISIAGLQTAMQSGKETAVSLVRKYSRRIDEFNQRGPRLRAVLEINPDAPAIARALDHERKAKGPRGPLHGIPVLIKDNLDTHDRMMTTAGSLALLGS